MYCGKGQSIKLIFLLALEKIMKLFSNDKSRNFEQQYPFPFLAGFIPHFLYKSAFGIEKTFPQCQPLRKFKMHSV